MRAAGRFEGLDTLRGCAVLAVLVFHYLNNTSVLRTPALLPVQRATEGLFAGVDMFFVLSGFFIGASLMRSKGRDGWLVGYGVQRAARLLPLYGLWLAIFFVMVGARADLRLGGAFPWLLESGGLPLWTYLVFSQNFASAAAGSWGPAWLGITWTLAVEVHFYVLAAIVVATVPVRFVGVAALLIIVGSVIFKELSIGGAGHPQMVLTPARLDAPFMGVLCAWLYRYDAVSGFITRNRRTLSASAAALVVWHYYFTEYGSFRLPMSGFTQNAIVFGVAVLAFAGPTPGDPNPVVRVLRWCGVRCYAIYLIHTGVLGLVSHVLFNWPPNVFPPGVGWPAVGLALFVTMSLAAFSWRWIEKPFINRASDFAARRKQEALPLNAKPLSR